ncbi:hypothetical protein B0H17DRAFT_1334417 [Mycena rosella]|uniref:TEA domain-containing protein n=1 Tax=Mycena rosella TaxID=1033263 RepID=A0AAD7D3Q6_MYCRO|nr:hypothetical protein B0H17DRAFT_1334417 [Mycena rosella]
MSDYAFSVFTLDDLNNLNGLDDPGTYTYGAQLPLITRSCFKSIKGGTGAVWPRHLEAALMQALFDYALTAGARPLGRKKHVNRNRYISDFILKTTRQYRTPTQVASRLQHMQTSTTDNRVKNLITNCDVPDAAPEPSALRPLETDMNTPDDSDDSAPSSPVQSLAPISSPAAPINNIPHIAAHPSPLSFPAPEFIPQLRSYPPPSPPPPPPTRRPRTPPGPRPKFYRPRFSPPFSPPAHAPPPHAPLPAPSRAARAFLAPASTAFPAAPDPGSEYPAAHTDTDPGFQESALRTTQNDPAPALPRRATLKRRNLAALLCDPC